MDQNSSNPEDIFKKSIQYFYNFYSSKLSTDLSNFIHKDSKTQKELLSNLYLHNSELESLLREHMDEDNIGA